MRMNNVYLTLMYWISLTGGIY